MLFLLIDYCVEQKPLNKPGKEGLPGKVRAHRRILTSLIPDFSSFFALKPFQIGFAWFGMHVLVDLDRIPFLLTTFNSALLDFS